MFKNLLPLEMLGTLRNPRLSRSWGLHQGILRCQGEASCSLAAMFGLARFPSGCTVLAAALYLPSSALRMPVFGAVFTPGGLVGSFLTRMSSCALLVPFF